MGEVSKNALVFVPQLMNDRYRIMRIMASFDTGDFDVSPGCAVFHTYRCRRPGNRYPNLRIDPEVTVFFSESLGQTLFFLFHKCPLKSEVWCYTSRL